MSSQVDIATITHDLVEAEPGLWTCQRQVKVSFPEDGHRTCFALEDDSFWFKHRNACIVATLRRFPPGGPIFDVGGGNGYVARGLHEAGFEVVVVEPGEDGARSAHSRGLEPVVCATLDAAFRPETLPAVAMFDVVEHVEDDVTFLRDTAALMEPGARLYLTVPAFQWLWSAEDVRAGHYRRYTQSTLCKVVERAGFAVEHATYFFSPLPLPILLLRSIPARLGRDKALPDEREHAGPGGSAKRVLDWLLSRELSALPRRSKHFGSSILLVARLA